MSKIPESYYLTCAGYLILQEPNEALLSDEYRRRFGLYCGVDRVPPLIAPDPAIRQAIGEVPLEDVRLAKTIDEWFDTRLGATAFIPSHYQALRLFLAFREHGFRFELVLCQLACKEGEEERQAAYAMTDEAAPTVSLTYGFDVSWPSCTHSAILQPGVVPTSLPWRQKLNQHGLLSDYEDATRLRDEYLLVYPYPPFDIFLVHKIDVLPENASPTSSYRELKVVR
jgi:hypothetical protein